MKKLVLNLVSGFFSLIVGWVVVGILYVFVVPYFMVADGNVPEELAIEGLMMGVFALMFALLLFYSVRKCVQWAEQALSSRFKSRRMPL